ncbi:hypothetical protein GCM10009809_17400 [Isoptericola hypogeus]|uniref:DUF4190 domain-containing protein n=1 Tax=Isoptericola hypogeus TaxID=300179 RepID=A0ABN2JC27_9MICO
MSDPYQPGQTSPTAGAPPPGGTTPDPQPGYTPSGYGYGPAPTSPQDPYPQAAFPQGTPAQGAYPQHTYPPYPQGQAYPYPGYAPEPPGRTLGIVGFILAFLVAPAGIVVSAMGKSQSKKAGVPNPLATWGLWLSIVFTSLWVLYVLFFVMLFAIGISGGAATYSDYPTELTVL